MIPANLPRGLDSKWKSLKHNSSKRIWHWVPIPYDKLSLEDSVNRLEWQLRVDHVPARFKRRYVSVPRSLYSWYVHHYWSLRGKEVAVDFHQLYPSSWAQLPQKMARYVFQVWFLLTSSVNSVLWKIPATSCLSLVAPATSLCWYYVSINISIYTVNISIDISIYIKSYIYV